jgi:hypothetical protein
MKRQNSILLLVIILSFFISFQSCEKSSSNISSVSIQNDSVKGQAIIGNSNSSVNYSPKGKFIQIIKPENGIWQNVILKKNNKEIEPKVFFHHDDITVSFLYDKLNIGDYELKYISELKDTIKEKLNFKKNIKLEFPNKLSEFYKEVEIQDLDIKNLKSSDTLQLLYQNYGCFGGSETLIEFLIKENNHINYRLKIDGLTSSEVQGKEWIHSNNLDLREELTNFITSAKNLIKTDLDLCTSDMNYIFRIKGTNIISIVEDKSCQLSDEIEELINKK